MIKKLDDSEMDYQHGVLLLNFIADFWDLNEQYNVQFPSERSKRVVYHQLREGNPITFNVL